MKSLLFLCFKQQHTRRSLTRHFFLCNVNKHVDRKRIVNTISSVILSTRSIRRFFSHFLFARIVLLKKQNLSLFLRQQWEKKEFHRVEFSTHSIDNFRSLFFLLWTIKEKSSFLFIVRRNFVRASWTSERSSVHCPSFFFRFDVIECNCRARASVREVSVGNYWNLFLNRSKNILSLNDEQNWNESNEIDESNWRAAIVWRTMQMKKLIRRRETIGRMMICSIERLRFFFERLNRSEKFIEQWSIIQRIDHLLSVVTHREKNRDFAVSVFLFVTLREKTKIDDFFLSSFIRESFLDRHKKILNEI